MVVNGLLTLQNAEPTEMFTSKVHISSDSVCTGAFGIEPVLLEFLETKEIVKTSDIC